MDSEFGFLSTPDQRSERRHRVGATRAQTIDLPNRFLPGTSAAISEEELQAQSEIQQFQKSLVTLAAAFHDDYGLDLNSLSRSGLERFVRRVPMRGTLSVGAESSGQLIATWRIGDDILSLQFVDHLRFDFAFTVDGPGGRQRHWGHGHALTFFDAQPLAARFAKP